MPRTSTQSGILPSKYVEPTSRYAKSKIIYYTDKNILTFETYKAKPKDFYRKGNGEWMEITPRYEFRPDALSFDLFGTPDLWWRLMEHNNIKDIIDFKTGINIQIPGNIFA